MKTSQDVKAAHTAVTEQVAEVEGRLAHEVLSGAERDALKRESFKLKTVARSVWDAYNVAGGAEARLAKVSHRAALRKCVDALYRDLAKAEQAFADADADYATTRRSDLRTARDSARQEVHRLTSAVELFEFGHRDPRSAGLSFTALDDRLVALLEKHGLRERHILHGQPLSTMEEIARVQEARLENALAEARKALESVGIVAAAEAVHG